MPSPTTLTAALAAEGRTTVSPSQLGTGTANSTTYLRGDNTWAAVASAGTDPLLVQTSAGNNTPINGLRFLDVSNGGLTSAAIVKQTGYSVGSPEEVCGVYFLTDGSTKGYLVFRAGGDINGTDMVDVLTLGPTKTISINGVYTDPTLLKIGASTNAPDTAAWVQINLTSGKGGITVCSDPFSTESSPFRYRDGNTGARIWEVIAETGGVFASGPYITAKTSAPDDSELSAGQLALWFDQTNGAAKAMWKGKTANGTVVTGSTNLS